MSPRKDKPYKGRPGYFASRPTGPEGGWVVVYDAAQCDLDDADGRWVVVCEAHAHTCSCKAQSEACTLMRAGSKEFCSACQAGKPVQHQPPAALGSTTKDRVTRERKGKRGPAALRRMLDLSPTREPKAPPPETFVCITCKETFPWKKRNVVPGRAGEFQCPGCVHAEHVRKYHELDDMEPGGKNR